MNKPFCLIIASDYPHGPFPKTGNYTKADIFKLPYDPNYVGNHKPGYYQNIKDDNDQLGKVLEMVEKYGHEESSMFIYASDHGLSVSGVYKNKVFVFRLLLDGLEKLSLTQLLKLC